MGYEDIRKSMNSPAKKSNFSQQFQYPQQQPFQNVYSPQQQQYQSPQQQQQYPSPQQQHHHPPSMIFTPPQQQQHKITVKREKKGNGIYLPQMLVEQPNTQERNAFNKLQNNTLEETDKYENNYFIFLFFFV
jgi:hypothetical protein